MMGQKNGIDKTQIEVISLDQLVPENHLVRKLEAAIDLGFIYELVKDLYAVNGPHSVDPVVLIKLVILQCVFGIRSMRQTIEQAEVNVAYRWYLGYGMSEKLPHYSTFSKNYERRFAGSNLFEQIFARVLGEIIKHGYLDAESVFIDGTHIKASANNHKYSKAQIEQQARYYEEELIKEIEADRKAHGKKPLKEATKPPEVKEIKVSKTDPDSGVFHKGEHQKVFAYTANVGCDRHGYIMGVEVAAGNLNDSTVFPKIYARLKGDFPEIEHVVLDAGFKTPAIAREILEDKRIPVMPYKRPMTKDGYYKKSDFAYDEYYDCYICPQNNILKYSTTNREGYREYKSDANTCKDCPFRDKCTQSKNHTKVVVRHVWEGYMEQVEDIRHTQGMKQLYDLRKETIERVFAGAKELHGMRYAKHRGIARVTMALLLLFACMNLKKLAIRLWNNGAPSNGFPENGTAFLALWRFLLNFLTFIHKGAPCQRQRALLSTV